MSDLRVRKIIAQALNVETVYPIQDLAHDLEASSFQRSDIALAIEKDLGVHLTEEQIENCRTVADVCKLVRNVNMEL